MVVFVDLGLPEGISSTPVNNRVEAEMILLPCNYTFVNRKSQEILGK
jgi:hypothetical protein